MALAIIQEQNLTDIADAIRSKNGASDTYKPSQMAWAIGNLPQPSGTIQITQNGTVNVAQYAEAEVSVANVDTLKALVDARQSAAYLVYKATALVDATPYIGYNTTHNARSCEYMYSSCTLLETVPLMDTSNALSLKGIFYQCPSLLAIPAFDCSNVTDFSSFVYGCTNLQEVHLLNIANNISFSGSSIPLSACREVISNLQQVSSTKTLTLPNSLSREITQSDVDAATAKGWTVTFA